MKKLSLLLILLGLMVATGGRAANYKLGKSLTLKEALTKDNVALVFQKDASSALQVIYYDTAKEHTSTDGQTHFTLGAADTVFTNVNAQYKFKIAADMTYNNATAYSIQFVDDSKYLTVEWNGENKADSKDNRPFTITAVSDGTANCYEFTCYRTDDNNADRAITFAGNGGTDAYWVKGRIYMYELADVYDAINYVPAKSSIVLSKITTLFNWGGHNSSSVDATNAGFTTTFKDSEADTTVTVNTGIGYKDLNYNVADFDKLVIKLTVSKTTESGDYPAIKVRVGDAGSNGNYQTPEGDESVTIDGTEQTITIDLSNGLSTNNDNKGTSAAITTIKEIYAWTMSALKVTFNEIYFEKNGGIDKDYIVRQNTTADKYGTICLPFAAAAPSNAKVYSVVGYDDNNVYLKEASSIEAGKAYVFQSSDANDITFTKNSTVENLTAPTSATSGLIGTFTASTSVPKDSYILSSNKWLKVTADGNNTVNQYRAYLTLSDDLKVATTPSGAKAMTVNGSFVTAINSVNAAKEGVNAPAYNLAGQRVGNSYKGVVIMNGKKYMQK